MDDAREDVVEVSGDAEEVSEVPVRKVKAKRFIFDDGLSLALIYEVQLRGAHLYAPGQKQPLFEKVREGFLKSREYKVIEKDMPTPSWRTLADRLFKMTGDRKAFVALMKKKSGVEEEYGEKERMLDAINDELQRKKETKLEAKKEKNERAEALKEAGEATRAMATRDWSGSGDDESPSRKKAKRNIFSVDSASDVLAATIDRQLKVEEERLKLEKDRFELARQQAEDARAQQEKLMDLIKTLVAERS
eukprot:IDg1920t1